MGEALLDLLARTGFEGAYGLFVFGVARPLGLLFGFQALVWAVGPGVSIRLAVAVAVGLPMLAANLPRLGPLIERAGALETALTAPREFAIGYALGLLASLPFLALQYAGAITDFVRGESDGGVPDPSGGTLTTFSTLYLVIGFSVFFAAGGLWDLAGVLYRSYAVWPVEAAWPALRADVALMALDLLGETLRASIRLAAPLLALLVVIEVAVGVAARLGRRTGFYEMAFPARNLAAILSLPLVAWFVHGASGRLAPDVGEVSGLLEALVP